MEYVFEPNGEIMTTNGFNHRLKKYYQRSRCSYHSVIKSAFTMLQQLLTEIILALSYLMGHSETATTLHYLRNVNKRKRMTGLALFRILVFHHKVFKGVQTF